MKNFLLLLFFLFFVIGVSAQDTLQLVQKDYDLQLKKTTYDKNPTVGKYYKVRGIKMYCETYGSGEPLLLIHGNGGSIDNFVYQIPYLSKKYKVIAVDSRTQGKSIDKGDSLSYEMMADDLAALLTEMKIESAHVLGWSDGGINALLLAQRHPEKVKNIAITGANLWPDSTAIEPTEWRNSAKGFKEISDRFNDKKPKTAQDSLSYKLQKLMFYEPNITLKQLSKIKAPVLVIGGDHDMIRPEHTMQIFRALPNASLWIVPNSGHATLVTHSAEFNKTVAAFFARTFRKRGEGDKFF
jgi:pimeloyl-ACP methyl ester carboxylesterase